MSTKNQTTNETSIVDQLKAELEAKEKEIASIKENKPDPNDLKRRMRVYIESSIGKRDPVTVRVNDYVAIIQRGVWVEVPYYVAMAIEESKEADVQVSMRVQELANSFAAEAARYK